MSNGWYPPPSKPRPVEGGLKAKSTRGAIAQTWWSQRFIAVLEGLGMGNRLQRGRTYARKGQVISLDVAPGSVTALVQGSRARPYRVRIGITAYGKGDWARLEQALAADSWYTASLLAGEMPTDIESLFGSADLPLFPADAADLALDCSCPDWEVPCKHLAAAFYLLAEAFDDDPFLILAWRGREREDLLDNLRAARGAAPGEVGPAATSAVPLEALLGSFFEMQAAITPTSAPATPSDALLDQLPAISARLANRAIVDLLRPAYRALGRDPIRDPVHDYDVVRGGTPKATS